MKSSKSAELRGTTVRDWEDEAPYGPPMTEQEKLDAFASDVRAYVEEHGYSLDQLRPLLYPLRGRSIQPVCFHPDDPELTWDGRGPVPEWMREWMSLRDLDPGRARDIAQTRLLLGS